jgi:hypothetical protein
MKRMARFQRTLASQASFEKFGRKSKREVFLDRMEQVVPWAELLALVEPFYPEAGNGRQPLGLVIMLRIYFLQQWFGLSDPGMEEAFYESPVRAAIDPESRGGSALSAALLARLEPHRESMVQAQTNPSLGQSKNQRSAGSSHRRSHTADHPRQRKGMVQSLHRRPTVVPKML